jgi:hypothetical protein
VTRVSGDLGLDEAIRLERVAQISVDSLILPVAWFGTPYRPWCYDLALHQIIL